MSASVFAVTGQAQAGVSTAAVAQDTYLGTAAVSAYRTGGLPNNAPNPGDSTSQDIRTYQFVNCGGGTACGTTGGTPQNAPNNLTSSNSIANYSDVINNVTSSSSATARADLATGALGGSSFSSNNRACSQGLCNAGAYSYARFDDLLTFTIAGANAFTQTNIGITWTLDGTLGGDNASVRNVLGFGNGQAIIRYGIANGGILDSGVQTLGSGLSGSFTSPDSSHTVFNGVYSLSGASQVIGISEFLETSALAFSSTGASADYSHTSNFKFILPSNVTFTSASGTFLSALTPAAGPVPEPATWATMFAGFAAMGASMRRRKIAQPLRVRFI